MTKGRHLNRTAYIFGLLTIVAIVLLLVFSVRFMLNFANNVEGTGAAAFFGGELSKDGKFGINSGAGDDRIAYIVTSNTTGRTLCKAFVYGDYVLDGWAMPSKYSGLLEGKCSYDYLTSYFCEELGMTTYSATIEPKSKDCIMPYYSSQNLDAGSLQKSDISYGKVSKTYTVQYYSQNTYSADDLAELAKTTAHPLSDEEREYRSYVYSNYLQIPDSTNAYMWRIVHRKGWTPTTAGIYKAVEDYIASSVTYSLEYDKSMDKESDVIVAFLDEYKTGVCQHYASAAVLLYRSIGIPARRVDGYAANTEANTAVNVTASNAHSWVEVYVDGVGWCPIDPTKRSYANDDDYSGIMPCPTFVPRDGADGKYYPFGASGSNLTFDSRTLDFLTGDAIDKINAMGGYYTAKVNGWADKQGENIGYLYDGPTIDGWTTGLARITEFKVFDKDGNEITSQFDCSISDGYFMEVYSILKIKTESINKKKDGTPIDPTGSPVQLLSSLPAGHGIAKLEFTASIADYGYELNAVVPTIVDSHGNDVTEHYGIDQSYFGWLHIYEYEITIMSGSSTTTFNNKEVENLYTRVTGTQNEADEIVVSDLKSYIDAGVYQNTFDVSIERNGKDVKDEYYIHRNYGTITINRQTMYVFASDASKAYDGTPLTWKDYTTSINTFGLTIEVDMPVSITEVGQAENYIRRVTILDARGRDITRNYIIYPSSGVLRIY